MSAPNTDYVKSPSILATGTPTWGVTQTIIAGHGESLPGNCLQACIATWFVRPIEEVPHFALFNSWHEALNLWLSDWYDMAARIRPYTEPLEGWHLLIGQSPRNPEWTHIVVAHGDEIRWDPHPSRDGLLDRRQTVELYEDAP